jgi:hypothetical protein
MEDFHLLDEAEDQWWGYSQKDGWVVMDFTDPRNRPPSSTRYLIRCQDQREVAIAYADWMPPTYTSAVDYLRTLTSAEEQAKAREAILAYQRKFTDLKKGVVDRKVREAQERERLAAEKVAKAQREQAEREAQQRAVEAQKREQISRICRRYGIDYFHHLTAIGNLQSILSQALLCYNRAPQHTDISNQSVQSNRRFKQIPQHSDLYVHDCVPLFVAPRPPMLIARRKDQVGIVYLHIDPLVLSLPRVAFTDGNAANAATTFFVNLDDMARLDWAVLRAHYWGCQDDEAQHKENMRRRGAEILVAGCIPVHFIHAISVMVPETQRQASQIVSSAGRKMPVRLDRSLYYPLQVDSPGAVIRTPLGGGEILF